MSYGHLAIFCGILVLCACDPKTRDHETKPQELPPTTQPPLNQGREVFELNPQASSLQVKMNAEMENIEGRSSEGLSGQIHFDAESISETTGHVRFDLFQLDLVHAIKRGDTGAFGELRKSAKQVDDMRIWLEIAGDTPLKTLNDYRFATFTIERIQHIEPRELPVRGGTTSIRFQADGTFRLHGLEVKKSVQMLASIIQTVEGVVSIGVRTTEPLVISLEDHDVRPRTAFSILADRTLNAMGKKINKLPQVYLNLNFVKSPSLKKTNLPQ